MPFSLSVGQGGMARLIRLLMVGILLFFAAARPAMAQSILRDSETELLFKQLSDPLIDAAGLDRNSVKAKRIAALESAARPAAAAKPKTARPSKGAKP